MRFHFHGQLDTKNALGLVFSVLKEKTLFFFMILINIISKLTSFNKMANFGLQFQNLMYNKGILK